MNGNTHGNLHSMDAICEGKKDASDQCNPFFDKTTNDIGPASFANNFAPNIYIQPTAVADTQSKQQSLFFSQEASSIFDKALEMHAAPTDDPPMWGDDLEDLREVADMLELEDIEDLSTGNEAVGQRDIYYPPNFKATSKKESAGCFFGDSGASTRDSLDFKSGNDVRSRVSGSNTAALNDETDLPLHIMNMDKRIFEENMFIGDITQAEGDDNMITDDCALLTTLVSPIFGNAVPYMLNSKHGTPDTGEHAETSRELKATTKVLPLGENADVYLPASKPNPYQATAALPIVTPRKLNSARIIDFKLGTPTTHAPMITPLPQVKASPEDLKDSMQGVLKCNNEKEADMAKNRTHNHQQDHHPKGTSKSDAAWKRRFLELGDFKRQHGHCNVQQKYEKNPR